MATNTGKYKLSAEAKKAYRVLCGDLNLIYDTELGIARESYLSGDTHAGEQATRNAGRAWGDAKHVGCGWTSAR